MSEVMLKYQLMVLVEKKEKSVIDLENSKQFSILRCFDLGLSPFSFLPLVSCGSGRVSMLCICQLFTLVCG